MSGQKSNSAASAMTTALRSAWLCAAARYGNAGIDTRHGCSAAIPSRRGQDLLHSLHCKKLALISHNAFVSQPVSNNKLVDSTVELGKLLWQTRRGELLHRCINSFVRVRGDEKMHLPVRTVSICSRRLWLSGGVSLIRSAKAAACGPILLASPA